jgi:hypothetical protein
MGYNGTGNETKSTLPSATLATRQTKKSSSTHANSTKDKNWRAVWKAIPPRIKTLLLEPEIGPDPAKDNKTVVISTYTNEWLIIRNTQGIPAHKNDKGQIVATRDPPISLPEGTQATLPDGDPNTLERF